MKRRRTRVSRADDNCGCIERMEGELTLRRVDHGEDDGEDEDGEHDDETPRDACRQSATALATSASAMHERVHQVHGDARNLRRETKRTEEVTSILLYVFACQLVVFEIL